jgi:tetratricopeptide (TPR) repeat protein
MNSASSIITAPYPGLRPFKQEEAELFFGRESQTNEMLTRLEAQLDFRFLAVIGASGSGKSSLVRAGLLPALSQGFLLGAPADWKFVTARPGNAPLRSLANAWVDTFHPRADQPDAAESARSHFALAQLRAGPLGLVRAYRSEKETQGHAVLILIDQFEELFRFRRERDSARRTQPVPASTQSEQAEPLDETSRTEASPTTDNAPTLEQQRNEAAAFVELLLATARQTEVPMYVVITMRSDFLGDCDAFLGLPEAISRSQYLTPRMTRSQLAEAITRPLELPQFGASIEQTLVTRILNDVGTDPDQLPLMQHALLRTWRAAADRLQAEGASPVQVSSSDYDTSGGVKHALSQDADNALEELRKMERGESLVHMAEMLFRSLAHQSEAGQLVRRPVQVSEVLGVVSDEPTRQDCEDLKQVLTTFEGPGRHFLMRTSVERQSAVERPPVPELNIPNFHLTDFIDISHESLLRQWGQVQAWFVREADAARQYRRLVDAVQAGEKRLTGDALDRALDWRRTRRTRTWAMRYDNAQSPEESLLPKCLELIEESKKVRDSEEAEAEFARKFRIARNVIAVLVLALLFRDPLKLDRLTVHDYEMPTEVQTALRDKGIVVLPKNTIQNLERVTKAENLAKELTALKLEKSDKYEVLHIKKVLEANFIELPEAVKISTSEQKTGAFSESVPEWLLKIREDLKQKGIDPLPVPIFAIKQSDLNTILQALKEILEKKGIVTLSDEDFKPIADKVVKLHALPDSVDVVLPPSEQTALIKLALKTPLLGENVLKKPQQVRTIDGIFRILVHLLVFFALVFGVETVYRRFAFRDNEFLERFQSRRSKVVFSIVLLLIGLVLFSFGLYGVWAKKTIQILGVPLGVILILLVPTDALLKRSWVSRFKEAQGILLQLYGFYALAGSVYLWLFMEGKHDWKPVLLLVQNSWALVIAGIGLVILGKRKCVRTAEETLVCEPDRAPVPVNSQTRLYSDRAIGLAAFFLFGWGLPAGWMMLRNLWCVGRRWAAGIGLVAPFVGIIGTIVFQSLIVGDYNSALKLEVGALSLVVLLGSPFATYWLWRRLSGREIRHHIAFRGAFQPLWKALLVLFIAGSLGWVLCIGVMASLYEFRVRAHIVAQKKVAEGQALARQGDIDGAIAAFEEARTRYPKIELDPETDTRDQDPQAVAQKFEVRGVARRKLDKGAELARQGDAEKALQVYVEAEKLDSSLTNAAFWNNVGWSFSLGGHAAQALIASEKAVELDPHNGEILDIRGLARALTGDTQGAIKDFEAAIASDSFREELKTQRRQWVDALRKGPQPFTPQLLEKLRSQ